MTTAQRKARRPPNGPLGILLLAGLLLAIPVAWAQYPLQYPSGPQITKDGTAILIEDYANPPLSSQMVNHVYPSPISYSGFLARVNAMRSEPANAPLASSRIFVVDMNGVIYTLDKSTRKFTPYLTFPEIFPKIDVGRLGPGVAAIAFDPNYAKNGKFYTVHSEDPVKDGSSTPTNAHAPGLNLDGYKTTPAINPPAGKVTIESVVVEWTDTNIKNSTFEGTAREVLRVGLNDGEHLIGDILFNPLAKPGQPDYENLYVAMGDGAAGETPGITHTFDQRLDVLQGKILRITPDITLRPKDLLSANGQYRIPTSGPDANPFVSIGGARGETFAYGFRNPHRITWDAVTDTLLADDIGLHYWEEVNIVMKGANYGYAEREGNEILLVSDGGLTGTLANPQVPFPATDLLTVPGLEKPVTPIYPAAVYSHQDGDSIGSGFVYRGKLMPQMTGKYIFSDMTTGRLFYADLAEMIASKGVRGKQATIHEIQVMYKNPYGSSTQAPVKRRMYDIVADAYAHKDGIPDPVSHRSVLPGGTVTVGGWRGKEYLTSKPDSEGVPWGGGRADVRLSVDGDGEIYILSKTDGMIRKMTAVVTPPPSSSKQTAAR